MQYIVDEIGAVVQLMRDSSDTATIDDSLPLYLYGHRVEIAARLTAMDANKSKKKLKYPLIALRLDTEEDVVGDVIEYNLNIAIINITAKGYNAEERYTNVFKPILYPIYNLFLQKLKASGRFMWPGDQESPPHKKVDRLYYGTPEGEGNVKNLFNDPVDAIEILNLRINQRKKTC